MLTSFKAVFFDAGGTLFRPFPSVGEIYQVVSAKYGCHTSAETLEKIFHDAWLQRDGLTNLASHSSEKIEKDWWRSLVHEVFSEVGGVGDFETFFAELYDAFASPVAWQLCPGALEVLRELKKRKKRLGIISNWDSRLFKLCEELGLGEYVEFVLASAVFGAAKPNPRIFEEALRRTGVAAREAVHVGDSFEDDVKGARGIGMEAILIDYYPEGKRTRGKDGHPQVKTVRSLRELIA